MRRSLREEIVVTAIRLFNEKGYSNVSMRNISGELGISVGNLTYHFQKKQDILQAIMQRNFQVTAMQGEVGSLAQFHELMDKMLASLSENAFYFRDPSLFPLNDNGIRDVEELYRIMFEGLLSLQQKGFLAEALSKERRESLVKILMLSHLAWIQQSTGFQPVAEMTKEQFLAAHWTLLEPYLTEKGWQEYRQLRECW